MKLVLASNNKKKLAEMRAIFAQMGIDVLTQEEAGVSVEPEETGETFEANAIIKAEAVMRLCGLPSVADDSGLVVEALCGEPGVYSARYGGDAYKTDMDRVELLLSKMNNVEHRCAKFVSCIACVFPNFEVLTAMGECIGEITRTPMGTGGFGYDPVFYLPEYARTMAQIEPILKNKISHRAAAIEAFKNKLIGYINLH